MGLHVVVVMVLLISSVVNSLYDVNSLELSRRYTYQLQLDDYGEYNMFYSYDVDAETIKMAVQVQTTGWIGFGFSPNGGMTGSDVVIGWVDKFGYAFLQVYTDVMLCNLTSRSYHVLFWSLPTSIFDGLCLIHWYRVCAHYLMLHVKYIHSCCLEGLQVCEK